MEFDLTGQVVANGYKEETFAFLGNFVFYGFENTGGDKRVPQLPYCVFYDIKCMSTIMRCETFYILSHKYFGTDFIYGTGEFKKECAPCVVEAALFPCVRECLTRETS